MTSAVQNVSHIRKIDGQYIKVSYDTKLAKTNFIVKLKLEYEFICTNHIKV